MADNWIKWTKGLPAKPEVVKMAFLMKKSRADICLILMNFWGWCDDVLAESDINENGSAFLTLSGNDDDNKRFLDELVGTALFSDSLASVGWIKFRNGRIELPNFGNHNGETAKTRARESSRKRLERAIEKRQSPDKKRTDGGQNQDKKRTKSGQNQDKKRTRGEEKREEETVFSPSGENTPPPTVEVPPESSATKPPPKKTREPDELFDAIAEVTGVSVKLRASLIAKICKELRAEEPPFTPAEVKEFGRRFHELCPFAIGERDRPELMELRNHVDKVRRPPPAKPPGGRGGKPVGGGGRMRTEPGEYAEFDSHGFSPEDLARTAAETPPDENAF